MGDFDFERKSLTELTMVPRDLIEEDTMTEFTKTSHSKENNEAEKTSQDTEIDIAIYKPNARGPKIGHIRDRSILD